MLDHERRTSPLAPLPLLVLLLAPACSVADASPRLADEANDSLAESALTQPADGDEQGRPPPPGPPPCETEGDCTDSCPPDFHGCTCHQLPHGPKLCVPTCAEDADCPELPPGAPQLSCREGICAPTGPPPPPPVGGDHPGPKPCSAEPDCDGACPPGSQGCTCHQVPHGLKLCVPTCDDASDCPKPPGGPPLGCREGICAPPFPPPPPPPQR